MATSWKGRTNSRPVFGGFSSLGMGWGKTGTTKRSPNRPKKAGGTGTASPLYRSVCNTFEKKIDSYRTLCSQISGPAKYGRPTPSTLNSFGNWIAKGAVVQCCSPAQVARWARNCNKNFNTHKPSTTACKTVLCKKFGRSTIKAVAMTKSGSFMVATSPTCNGRSFSFPH